MDRPEPLYYDDEPTGTFATTDDDGVTIEFTGDGTAVAAWTEDGEDVEIDAGRFAWDLDRDRLVDQWQPPAPTLGEDSFESAVQQAVEERLAGQPVVHAPGVIVETDADILAKRWQADIKILENERGGLQYTLRERELLTREALADLDRGGGGSLLDASQRLIWNRELEPIDPDNSSDRHGWLAEAIQDNERVGRNEGDDNYQGLEPVRGTGVYHEEDDQERGEYLTLRAQGHTDIVLVPGHKEDTGDAGVEEW